MYSLIKLKAIKISNVRTRLGKVFAFYCVAGLGSVCLLVGGFVGLLVCWFVGLLVCWLEGQ